ncbi:MAG: rhodanese-like domain-containing protein [Peptoniphilaceae bacterium]|nr:rhodanese-like domain-containing protein [Peptoniphilaceae bacterium]MDY6018538.1 rhodanese-like domain-containing protein [Anaerococcus sp.]
MGLFNLFKSFDIDDKIKEFEKTKDAVLLDVREKDEYEKGHIPQAINIPLSEIDQAENIITNKDKKILVYCLSGSRSDKAENILRQKGYKDVENIGGFMDYSGEVE